MPYTVEYEVDVVFTTSGGVVAVNALIGEIEADGLINTMLDKSGEGVHLGYDGGVQKCYIPFKIQPTQDELDALLLVCNAHAGEEVFDPVTADGRPLVGLPGEQEDRAIAVCIHSPIGADLDVYSPDFTEPLTWWPKSKKVVDEELQTSDQLTFTTTNQNILNVYSGLVADEKKLWPEYVPVVKVDGTPKTRHNPFSGTGGDYSIDHSAGTVTFDQAQTGTVTMTYYWVDTSMEGCSTWEVEAPEGKGLYIRGGKVSLCPSDWDMTTYLIYEILIGDMVVGYSRYDTADQLLDVSGEMLADVDSAVGGVTRGTNGPRCAYRIRYVTTRNLYGAPYVGGGMKLRIRLGGDVPFGGSRFTINLIGLIQSLA